MAVVDPQAPANPAFGEFHEFVVRHGGRLERACREIAGHDDVAATLRADLLVDVAARWRRWPVGSRPTKALFRLEKLLRREARRHGDIAHRAALNLSSTMEYRSATDESTVDDLPLASVAWRRATRLRQQRWAGIGVVTLVVVAAVGFSLRGDPAPEPVPIPLPTTTEDGVTVLPRFSDLLQLPAGLTGPLPEILSLEPADTDAMTELARSPLNHAVLATRGHGGRLVLLGPGGVPRRFDDPRLSDATLLPTSLSPRGQRVALALGSNVLLIDVFAGTSRLLAVEAQQPDPPIITWLNEDTLIVPRNAGARVVDVRSGTSFDISEPAEDVATIRGDSSMPFVKLIGGGAGPDEALIETWQVTLSPPPAQRDPTPSIVGLGGTGERIAVPGPPWMRSWSGPGWWSPSLAARGCDPTAVDLPSGLEAPRGAVTAAWVRGHIGTLVSLDSELMTLGFRQYVQVLVAVRGESETQLLGWNPFEEGNTRIYRLTTLMASTDVSLSDLAG